MNKRNILICMLLCSAADYHILAAQQKSPEAKNDIPKTVNSLPKIDLSEELLRLVDLYITAIKKHDFTPLDDYKAKGAYQSFFPPKPGELLDGSGNIALSSIYLSSLIRNDRGDYTIGVDSFFVINGVNSTVHHQAELINANKRFLFKSWN